MELDKPENEYTLNGQFYERNPFMNDTKIHENNTQSDFYDAPEILEKKIGGTTYIITGKYRKSAKETLPEKLWRLIENNAE
jgi:hypothetical protein